MKKPTPAKVAAYIIGVPILLAGLIIASPVIILACLFETIKWATLNIGDDYKWGGYDEKP